MTLLRERDSLVIDRGLFHHLKIQSARFDVTLRAISSFNRGRTVQIFQINRNQEYRQITEEIFSNLILIDYLNFQWRTFFFYLDYVIRLRMN